MASLHLLLLPHSLLYLWGSPVWVRFLRMWPFSNPTIKVVTFRRHGWCVLGVFLLPGFTHLGHERQDLLSPCNEMRVCVCTQTRPRFILSSERVFLGNGVRNHVNSKGKIPSTGKFPQRRIEPAMLHYAGQRAQTLPRSYWGPKLSVILTLHFLMAAVDTLNTKTHSSTEMAQFSFECADVKNISYSKQRVKSKLSQSSECVQTKLCKPCTSFTLHLHSWCGMVWYILSPTQLVWNGVVYTLTYTAGVEWCGIYSHLHSWCGMVWYIRWPTQLVWNGVVYTLTYTAGVEWCGIYSHLHSWCGMVWYILSPTQLVWNGVVYTLTYTAGVEWCGIYSHLHSWCGMVWYRAWRVEQLLMASLHLLLLLRSQLYLWDSPVLVRFLRMWPFCNPTREVVTFRLCGWCMLGVFLLPAFTRLGHECQDLLSRCDGMHVCTAQTIPWFILSSKRILGNGVRTYVNSKGKIPCTRDSEEVRTRDAASRRTGSPAYYQLSYSGPIFASTTLPGKMFYTYTLMQLTEGENRDWTGRGALHQTVMVLWHFA